MIGFDVLVDTNVKIAMLRSHEADEEVVGLKRANVVSFTMEQYHLLLVLWEVYLENLGYSEENVVMRGDLIDKIKAYEVDVDKSRLSAAMKIFKKYDLIDYDTKDESEDAIITLYPSLQFGWDIAQFQTVTAEYMKNSVAFDDADLAESENREEGDEKSHRSFVSREKQSSVFPGRKWISADFQKGENFWYQTLFIFNRFGSRHRSS